MVAAVGSGYSVDDLDWVRAQLGVAHVELDPWGNLIVSPASDVHGAAVAALAAQLTRQLSDPSLDVVVNGVAWRVADASGYLHVPDVTVVEHDWHLRLDEQIVPPPALVIEVASPSTRTVDRTRKLDDYLRGGADGYLLVDVPTLSAVDAPTFELHHGDGRAVVITRGRLELQVRSDLLELDLTGLRLPGGR